MRPLLPLAFAALLAACGDFTVAPRPPPPSIPEAPPNPTITSVEPSANGGDGKPYAYGYWKQNVVIRGKDLGSDVTVTFNGLAPHRVLVRERDRIVVQVPDLGADIDGLELKLTTARRGPDQLFEWTLPFEFLGPGEVRGAGVSSRTSLVAALTQFAPLRSLDAPPPSPGTDANADLLQEAAQDLVLATGNADFAVPLSLRSNVMSGALEEPRPVLATAAAGTVVTGRNGAIPLAMVFNVDFLGFVHRHVGILGKIQSDTGAFLQEIAALSSEIPDRAFRLTEAVGQSSAQALLVPSSQTGELARLVVMGWDAKKVTLTVFPVVRSPLSLVTLGSPKSVDLLPGGAPALFEAGGHLYLAGALSPGGRPLSDGALWEISFPGGGLTLSPVPVIAKGSTTAGKLDDALAYRSGGRLELVSVAATPAGDTFAVSFVDQQLPRLALLKMTAGGALEVQRTSGSANALRGLAFGHHDGGQALYAFEGLTGRIVRIGDDLRIAASFEAPGSQATTYFSALVPSVDGERLLFSDVESGAISQFATASESFLPHLPSKHSFGPNQGLYDDEIFSVLNTGVGDGLPAPGQLALSIPSSKYVMQLGGSSAGTSSVAFERVIKDKAFVFAVTGAPGRVYWPLPCGTDASCPAGQSCSADGTRCQLQGTGELRLTVVGFDASTLVAQSDSCMLGGRTSSEALWTPRSVAVSRGTPDTSVYVLLGGLTGGASTRVVKAPVNDVAPPTAGTHFAQQLCDSLEAAPTVWRSDAASGEALRVVSTPTGGAVVQLASGKLVMLEPGAAPVTFPAATDDTPLDPTSPDPRPRLKRITRVGIDVGACSSTFRPLAWTFSGNDISVYPLMVPDTAGVCRAPSKPDVFPFTNGEQIMSGVTDVLGVYPSPNGGQVLVLADEYNRTHLMMFEVERDETGDATSILLAHDVDLGPASDLVQNRNLTGLDLLDKAGVTYSDDGSTAYITVNGDSTLAAVE